jgi:hypothetical protein
LHYLTDVTYWAKILKFQSFHRIEIRRNQGRRCDFRISSAIYDNSCLARFRRAQNPATFAAAIKKKLFLP